MSFTIHGIDPELDERLRRRAREERVSKNRLVKRLLARAVGLGERGAQQNEYREFLGLWSEDQRQSFDDVQAENRLVDPEDWK
jgi:hypothetical protein